MDQVTQQDDNPQPSKPKLQIQISQGNIIEPAQLNSPSSSSHQDDEVAEGIEKEKDANAEGNGQEEKKKETVEEKEKDEQQQEDDEVKRQRDLYLRKLEEQLLEEQRVQMEILNSLQPEPLTEKRHYAEGSDAGGWRKRKVRNIKKRKTKQDEVESSDCASELPGGNEGEEGEEEVVAGKEGKIRKKKKNKNVQEKLVKSGNKIALATERNVRKEQYQGLFKYMIYDGYRPQTLAHARDYLNFLIRDNLCEDEHNTLPPEQLPQHIMDYLEQENQTKLPNNVNEDEVLDFDQNFECGNLDSVYLVDAYEYNLLMKVDTNTKGNTYWFMFKVSDFMVGIRYRFNVLNFSRNMDLFYNNGMNVVIKREKKNAKARSETRKSAGSGEEQDGEKSQGEGNEENDLGKQKENDSEKDDDGKWIYDACEAIQFFPQSEVVRSMRKNPETGEVQNVRYFSKLTFCYKFKPEDRDKVVTFAYAVPYGYTDLVKDLEQVRKNLMAMTHSVYKPLTKEDYLESGEPVVQGGASPKADNPYCYIGAQGQGQGATNEENNAVMRNQMQHRDKARLEQDRQAQKLTHYELQHLSIKRQGIALMKNNNQFEQQVNELDHSAMQQEFNFDQQAQAAINKGYNSKDLNFEIVNKFLHYRQEVVGQSMCGLNLYQLTITKRREHSIKHKKKAVIYIQARLHAAETHGSLIMQHLMHEITSNAEKYDRILSDYVVKLLPMLNPDGVVIGNSRSSLAGVDLNRRWSDPHPTMHPEIYFIKRHLALAKKQSKGISMFCDLHGHNRQMNCFIYGCNKAPNEGLLSWTKTRLFPKILASIEPIFNFNDCSFSQEKLKYNTARVVVWNEFKVTNSFTLETSMYGKKMKDAVLRNDQTTKKLKTVSRQLTLEDFQSIGLSLLSSINQYIELEIQLEKEYMATGGWLKKKRLDQMAGETAREQKERDQQLQIQQQRQLKKQLTLRKSQINLAKQSSEQVQISKFAANQPNSPLFRDMQSPLKPKEKNTAGKVKKQATSTQRMEKSPMKLVQNHDPDSPTKFKKSEKKTKNANKSNQQTKAVNEDSGNAANGGGNSENQVVAPQATSGVAGLPPKPISRELPKGGLPPKQISIDQHQDDCNITNWMQFFSQNEIDSAITESVKPVKKLSKDDLKRLEENEEDGGESDSEPSCDNYEEEELADRFDAAISEDERVEPKVEPPKPPPKVVKKPDTAKDVVKNPPADLDPLKKKNGLGKRFDMLKQQLNARIIRDNQRRAEETSCKHQRLQNWWPIKNLQFDLTDQPLKNDARTLSMIQHNIATQQYNQALEKLKLQGKDCSIQQARNASNHYSIQPSLSKISRMREQNNRSSRCGHHNFGSEHPSPIGYVSVSTDVNAIGLSQTDDIEGSQKHLTEIDTNNMDNKRIAALDVSRSTKSKIVSHRSGGHVADTISLKVQNSRGRTLKEQLDKSQAYQLEKSKQKFQELLQRQNKNASIDQSGSSVHESMTTGALLESKQANRQHQYQKSFQMPNAHHRNAVQAVGAQQRLGSVPLGIAQTDSLATNQEQQQIVRELETRALQPQLDPPQAIFSMSPKNHQRLDTLAASATVASSLRHVTGDHPQLQPPQNYSYSNKQNVFMNDRIENLKIHDIRGDAIHRALFKSSMTPAGNSHSKYLANLHSIQRYRVPRKQLDGRALHAGIQQRLNEQKQLRDAVISNQDINATETSQMTLSQPNSRTIAQRTGRSEQYQQIQIRNGSFSMQNNLKSELQAFEDGQADIKERLQDRLPDIALKGQNIRKMALQHVQGQHGSMVPPLQSGSPPAKINRQTYPALDNNMNMVAHLDETSYHTQKMQNFRNSIAQDQDDSALWRMQQMNIACSAKNSPGAIANTQGLNAGSNPVNVYIGDHGEVSSYASSAYHVPNSVHDNMQKRQLSQMIHQSALHPQLANRLNQSKEFVLAHQGKKDSACMLPKISTVMAGSIIETQHHVHGQTHHRFQQSTKLLQPNSLELKRSSGIEVMGSRELNPGSSNLVYNTISPMTISNHQGGPSGGIVFPNTAEQSTRNILLSIENSRSQEAVIDLSQETSQERAQANSSIDAQKKKMISKNQYELSRNFEQNSGARQAHSYEEMKNKEDNDITRFGV